ncbi:hypothetical protein Dimus_031672 [Dionaea muscipula]
MRRRMRMMILQSVFLLECYLHVCTMVAAREVVKADAYTPVTTWSPPEGNTTFLDGTTWCVGLTGASMADLQNGLDWACGPGMVDCGPIRAGGSCYVPDTLLSHASYAFNSYFQQNGNSDIACNFGGTAVIVKKDPSKIYNTLLFHIFSLGKFAVGESIKYNTQWNQQFN